MDNHKGENKDEDRVLSRARQDIDGARTLEQLERVKAAFLGRNGQIQKMLHGIGGLPQGDRPAAGARLNVLRAQFVAHYERRRQEIQQARIDAQLGADEFDIGLPGRCAERGGLHPLTLSLQRAVDILLGIGFEIADGPEIESDYYNFTALNHPPDHPARSMHDTFYLEKSDCLLRTHTSPVQIRHMLEKNGAPPIRAIAPGRVYRCDHSPTHSPMFHQIEGLWIDRAVTFSDLKGLMGAFFRAFFDDDDIVVRFRPSFFPFTEPSAECDIFRRGKWLEVAGCGMVHPNVLAAGGVDADQCRGFAFGMGVERLSMLYYEISDIRGFFENDIRFLRQFCGE